MSAHRLFILLSASAASFAFTGCATPEPPAPPVEIRRAELAPPPVAAPPADGNRQQWPGISPGVFAGSAIMIDARTGRVLYQKNADQIRPVASTQKLLTALVLLERGSMSDRVRIQASDTTCEPVKLGLRAGEVYTKQQLFAAMMVKSSNDAAAALARRHSGSVAAFAAEMNRKAHELGAFQSHFSNPHGLPAEGQHSTARDMAKISFAAYREPSIRQYARMKQIAFQFASGRTVMLESTNKLLTRDPSVNGLKTGYTAASGRCLVTSAATGAGEVILVQLGSNTRNIFNDAEALVDWRLRRSSPEYAWGG